MKHWIMSQNKENMNDIKKDVEVKTVDSSGEKVLGMLWNPKEDSFKFKVHINFTQSRKGRGDKVEMTRLQVIEEPPRMLTLRVVLGQIAKVYDPFGFLIPYILASK